MSPLIRRLRVEQARQMDWGFQGQSGSTATREKSSTKRGGGGPRAHPNNLIVSIAEAGWAVARGVLVEKRWDLSK